MSAITNPKKPSTGGFDSLPEKIKINIFVQAVQSFPDYFKLCSISDQSKVILEKKDCVESVISKIFRISTNHPFLESHSDHPHLESILNKLYNLFPKNDADLKKLLNLDEMELPRAKLLSKQDGDDSVHTAEKTPIERLSSIKDDDDRDLAYSLLRISNPPGSLVMERNRIDLAEFALQAANANGDNSTLQLILDKQSAYPNIKFVSRCNVVQLLAMGGYQLGPHTFLTALRTAAESGDVARFENLLKHTSEIDTFWLFSILNAALCKKHFKIIDIILSIENYKIKPSDKNQKPTFVNIGQAIKHEFQKHRTHANIILENAVMADHFALTRLIYENTTAEERISPGLLLDTGANHGSTEAIKYPIKECSPSIIACSITRAVEAGHANTLKAIFESAPEFEIQPFTLHAAFSSEDMNIPKLILENGLTKINSLDLEATHALVNSSGNEEHIALMSQYATK